MDFFTHDRNIERCYRKDRDHASIAVPNQISAHRYEAVALTRRSAQDCSRRHAA